MRRAHFDRNPSPAKRLPYEQPVAHVPVAHVPMAITADGAPPPVPSATTALSPVRAPTAPTGLSVRLFSTGYLTRIRSRPDVEATFLGYIRYGAALSLASDGPVPGHGCSRGFYRVEPRGYVCSDQTVTLEPAESLVAFAADNAPMPGPYPYHYAFSLGAPMYERVPSDVEQRRNERELGPVPPSSPTRNMGATRRRSTYKNLVTYRPILPDGPIPSYLTDESPFLEEPSAVVRRTLPAASTIAFTRAFAFWGERFFFPPTKPWFPRIASDPMHARRFTVSASTTTCSFRWHGFGARRSPRSHAWMTAYVRSSRPAGRRAASLGSQAIR